MKKDINLLFLVFSMLFLGFSTPTVAQHAYFVETGKMSLNLSRVKVR